MIRNAYTETVGRIGVSEDFKRELLAKLRSRESAPAKRGGGALRKRPWVWAVASVFAAAAITVGVLLGSGVFTVKSGTSGVLPPHFTVNNRAYWATSEKTPQLSSGYRFIGTIKSYGNGNFQAAGPISVGSKIYIDPTNPYAAYISNIVTYFKGNQVAAKPVFELYVTRELRESSVYYHGRLYYAYGDITGFPGSKYIGTIADADMTRLPSHNFATNEKGVLGCRVYLSTSDDQVLYIQKTDGELLGYKNYG